MVNAASSLRRTRAGAVESTMSSAARKTPYSAAVSRKRRQSMSVAAAKYVRPWPVETEIHAEH